MRPTTEGFRPRRAWGQNFLVNTGAAETIVRAFLPRTTDRVLEIGPGDGALTRRVVGRVARLVAVEIDPALAAALRQSAGEEVGPGAFEVLEADIMAVDPERLLATLGATPTEPGRVLANLPYNIATAVILRLLPLRPRLRDLMVMVQREVAGRITAKPCSKAYGSLSILCQSFARIDSILRVGPGSFRPRPRVDSEVLRLVLRDPGGAAGRDFEGYARLLRFAFAARRKTIGNNLAAALSRSGIQGHGRATALLEAAGIAPGRRAEEIPVQGFQTLYEAWSAGGGL